MNEQEIDQYLQNLNGVSVDSDIRDGIVGYRAGREGRLFALVYSGTNPVRIGLRCDANLAGTLRATYETIMPSSDMDQNTWNTIVCSGRPNNDELKDFVRHAYELVNPSGWF